MPCDLSSDVETIDSVSTGSSFPLKPVAVRRLHALGLKFGGEDREDAEGFLQQLQE